MGTGLQPAKTNVAITASISFFIGLFVLGLAGCQGKTATQSYFLPPTPASGASSNSGSGLTYPSAMPTPICTNNLHFLADGTIPDGSLFTAGALIDKQWQVENNGSCNWDGGYRLRLIAGDPMDAPVEQALFPARGGTQAVIRMILVAPNTPGIHQSAWQAYSPQGEPFGDLIFINIVVAP